MYIVWEFLNNYFDILHNEQSSISVMPQSNILLLSCFYMTMYFSLSYLYFEHAPYSWISTHF